MTDVSQEVQYPQFLKVSYFAYLAEETKAIGEHVNKPRTPKGSIEKKSQKSPVELQQDFNEKLMHIADKLLTEFQCKDVYFLMAKITFDFFHEEERMRPLMKINDPVRLFLDKLIKSCI